VCMCACFVWLTFTRVVTASAGKGVGMHVCEYVCVCLRVLCGLPSLGW